MQPGSESPSAFRSCVPMKSQSAAREVSTEPGAHLALSRTRSNLTFVLPALIVILRARQLATAALPALVSFSFAESLAVLALRLWPPPLFFFFLGLSFSVAGFVSGAAVGSSKLDELVVTLTFSFFF